MAILRWLSTVNSYLLLIGGAFVMLLMAYSVHIAYTPLLWVDQWAFLQELVGNHGHYSLPLLWKQRGDHQIALPKLFYLADLYLFDGTNKLLLFSIFFLQLLHLGWLITTFRFIGGLRGASLRTASALAACCLFWLGQSELFWFGSDLPVCIPYVGATVALSSLGFYVQRHKTGQAGPIIYLVVAWTGAAAASFSLSNGLLLWPLLILLMVVWRVPYRFIGITAGLTLFVFVSWRLGYSVTVQPPHLSSLPLLARYLLTLYGSSWPGANETFVRVIAGIVLPMLPVGFVWVLWKRNSDVFAVLMLSIANFALVSTTAAAVGRIAWGVEQARAGRYQTAAMLLWCCVFALIIRACANSKLGNPALLPVQALLAAMILLGAHLASTFLDGSRI
jgi:hypothetical protein